jgi:hypothetical protein
MTSPVYRHGHVYGARIEGTTLQNVPKTPAEPRPTQGVT